MIHSGPVQPYPLIDSARKRNRENKQEKTSEEIKRERKEKKDYTPAEELEITAKLKNTQFCLQLDGHFQKHKALRITHCTVNHEELCI